MPIPLRLVGASGPGQVSGVVYYTNDRGVAQHKVSSRVSSMTLVHTNEVVARTFAIILTNADIQCRASEGVNQFQQELNCSGHKLFINMIARYNAQETIDYQELID